MSAWCRKAGLSAMGLASPSTTASQQPPLPERLIFSANRISKLPTIVDLVVYDFLSVAGHLHYELNGLAVHFLKRIGILDDIPARPAVEMLHDAHLDGRGLVIANLDFEGFVDPPPIEVGSVFRAAALSGHVKCAPGIQTDSLVLGRVVDIVLACELELSIVVTAVETDSPFWKRHTEMIRGAVFELLHHPYLRIGERAVTLLLADILERPIPVILVDF